MARATLRRRSGSRPERRRCWRAGAPTRGRVSCGLLWSNVLVSMPCRTASRLKSNHHLHSACEPGEAPVNVANLWARTERASPLLCAWTHDSTRVRACACAFACACGRARVRSRVRVGVR
eukprot:2799142-Pleurochrysis_carterae.AAC.2